MSLRIRQEIQTLPWHFCLRRENSNKGRIAINIRPLLHQNPVLLMDYERNGMTVSPSLRTRMKSEVQSVLRFAIVGILAAITHSIVALVILNSGFLSAFPANIIGFLVAFCVSFSGHHFWSFGNSRQTGQTKKRMRRFFILALTGFAINSTSLLGWLTLTNWSENIGILVSIAVVPVFTFFGARFWAFAAHPE